MHNAASRTWTYMYVWTTRHALGGKTAIVGNVLAGARIHRMRPHRHHRRVYAPTYPYNRPYCLAIAFQPSTVYGLARLLVLCRGACLFCYIRGRACFDEGESDAHDDVIPQVGEHVSYVGIYFSAYPTIPASTGLPNFPSIFLIYLS